MTNFTLASRWGCILLLDEADVFLAARTPTDTLRNGVVSGALSTLGGIPRSGSFTPLTCSIFLPQFFYAS